MIRATHVPLPLASSSQVSHNQKEMGVSTKQHDNVLKVVHPGRYVQIFRRPITAGELMRKYPRHCIARPDVFQFPWIVVRPESVLVPGKVFYLMPYRTLDKLLKAKRQELQSSELINHQDSPTKSLAGVTPKHLDGVFRRKLHDNEEYYRVEKQEQEFDAKSLYKMEFYESWTKMRRILEQSPGSYDDQMNPGLDSPFNGGFERVMSPNQRVPSVNRLRSCLRKRDSDRKQLNLKVSFASPVAIVVGCRRLSPSVRRGAPVVQD